MLSLGACRSKSPKSVPELMIELQELVQQYKTILRCARGPGHNCTADTHVRSAPSGGVGRVFVSAPEKNITPYVYLEGDMLRTRSRLHCWVDANPQTQMQVPNFLVHCKPVQPAACSALRSGSLGHAGPSATNPASSSLPTQARVHVRAP